MIYRRALFVMSSHRSCGDFLSCFFFPRRERGQYMGLECFFLVFVMHICRIRWGWFGVGIKGGLEDLDLIFAFFSFFSFFSFSFSISGM